MDQQLFADLINAGNLTSPFTPLDPELRSSLRADLGSFLTVNPWDIPDDDQGLHVTYESGGTFHLACNGKPLGRTTNIKLLIVCIMLASKSPRHFAEQINGLHENAPNLRPRIDEAAQLRARQLAEQMMDRRSLPLNDPSAEDITNSGPMKTEGL